jgi:hypothetical protein
MGRLYRYLRTIDYPLAVSGNKGDIRELPNQADIEQLIRSGYIELVDDSCCPGAGKRAAADELRPDVAPFEYLRDVFHPQDVCGQVGEVRTLNRERGLEMAAQGFIRPIETNLDVTVAPPAAVESKQTERIDDGNGDEGTIAGSAPEGADGIN